MRCRYLLSVALSAATLNCLGVSMPAQPQEIHFTIENPRAAEARDLVRVSLPVPQGLIVGAVPDEVVADGRCVPVQASPITYHPDGSVRRVMLTLPIKLRPNSQLACTYGPGLAHRQVQPLADVKAEVTKVPTEAWTVYAREGVLQIASGDGAVLAVVEPFGPDVAGPSVTEATVIENGAEFVWLRWRQDGTAYSREVDCQVDRLGRLRLTQRLLRHLEGNGWAPDFGFRLTAVGGTPVRLPERPVHFRGLGVENAHAVHPDVVASLRLRSGELLSLVAPLALAQRRGTLKASGGRGIVTVELNRNEPVAEEMEGLQVQEGMWRETCMVLHPGSPEQLLQEFTLPLVTNVDWRAFDAVYHTGPPLQVRHPLLRRLAEKYAEAVESLSMTGDDWGSLGGLERYNHCQYIWEDYFRTGDIRLRRVALDYSSNYNNMSVYWGPKPDFYGGSRYPADSRTQPWPTGFRTRHNDAVSFCTKGYHSFWLAYEETGDPRFRYAAEQQAEWSSRHVTAGLNYTRCIGQVTDFVKMHEYTGRSEYLEQARRLWAEFRAVQGPDLLFTESGRLAVGNDLYVPDDNFGYEHPFVKSYITQYATNALPYLLAHQPDDQRLRDTIVACNDWMARVQTAGGGWSYPGPTTAGFAWNTEYCHGLMMGYEVEPRPEYLDAVQRDLRAIVALFSIHNAIPSGVTPWETLAGKTTAEMASLYHLGTDRDRTRDFTDGMLSFGFSPDSTVYMQVVLRDYLAHRAESSLFAEDPILGQILGLPVSGSQYPQAGDPSLRIVVEARDSEGGLAVKLAGKGVYRLSETPLSLSWVLPDGSVVQGAEAQWTFPRAGTFTIALRGATKGQTYARHVTIVVPVGPGDLGFTRWPDGVRIQAETFSKQGGGASEVRVRTSKEKRGSDGGAISHWDSLGAWVDWEFTIPQTGAYFLLARYACPVTSQRRAAIDGRDCGTLSLPATGGYSSAAQDDWRVELLRDAGGEPIALKLTAGRHTLRLANTDGVGCNLDYVDLLPEADALGP